MIMHHSPERFPQLEEMLWAAYLEMNPAALDRADAALLAEGEAIRTAVYHHVSLKALRLCSASIDELAEMRVRP